MYAKRERSGAQSLQRDAGFAHAILADLARGTSGAPSDFASGEPAPDAEARYRALVEQLPAVVFIADLDQCIGQAYVSPHIEATLGFTREEWLEDPIRWYQQIHPDDQERWSAEAAEVFLTGRAIRTCYRVLARDGRVVWFQCEAKVMRHEDGRPWFIHAIAFDITELKRRSMFPWSSRAGWIRWCALRTS